MDRKARAVAASSILQAIQKPTCRALPFLIEWAKSMPNPGDRCDPATSQRILRKNNQDYRKNMNTTELVSAYFDVNVRRRGLMYFQDGSIDSLTVAKRLVIAEVSGTDLYFVEILNPRPGHLVTSCSCPYFVGGSGLCKHIWGTMLAAEKEGWNPDLPGPNGRIEISANTADEIGAYDDDFKDEFDDELDGLDLYDEDEDEDEDEIDGLDAIDSDFVNKITELMRSRVRSSDPQSNAGFRARKPPQQDKWLSALTRIHQSITYRTQQQQQKERLLYYVVKTQESLQYQGVYIELFVSEKRLDGTWGKPQKRSFDKDFIETLGDETDREIVSALIGMQYRIADPNGFYSSYYRQKPSTFLLSNNTQFKLLKRICDTGRAQISTPVSRDQAVQLNWDDSDPWKLELRIAKVDASYCIEGFFSRGDERMPIDRPHLLLAGGLVFWEDRVAVLVDHNCFEWIVVMRRDGDLQVPLDQELTLIQKIYEMPASPPMELPQELRLQPVHSEPTKELLVSPRKNDFRSRPWLGAEINFRYQGILISASDLHQRIIDREERRVIHRNPEREQEALEELLDLGFKPPPNYMRRTNDKFDLEIAPGKFTGAVSKLIGNGWRVEAEGKLYRRAQEFDIRITSGIDWFELHGGVRFDQNTIALPKLLQAIRKGSSLVELGDGSFGVLPEQWLQKVAPLVGLGEVKHEHIEFKKSQAGLLDALIANLPDARVDKTFAKIRDNLVNFNGLKPKNASRSFKGRLREYQRDGLGWFSFLQKFGMGGCLADDMGLGKTVQVLALLDGRQKTFRSVQDKPPSIVVVPRSLVFNWREEAQKFTPRLKVLSYIGPDRKRLRSQFSNFDIVLTTYGTLRRDISKLCDTQFDYAILDEAQAIKNAASQSAKAVRLLNAEHHLALSGTPIENHLGELWSLFEFLNPGMLGRVRAFDAIKNNGARQVFKQALRPFILRRTKSQVAKDLPQKTEQTIYCEMSKKQKTLYDELKSYYQVSLMDKIKDTGMGRAKIQVLEALLRLRQAACHPGLIDKNRERESSVKLESLWEQLNGIIEGGHKALVFSQFTSFLSIFRKTLDETNIPYLYLDGRTNKRQQLVDAFQSGDTYKLFLISMKAGGLGLNLTEADYVFLLDPWWNPAVEAQAIDRAHRIGQQKNVFAYRMISRDTVEEKVLELQKHKRELVESIITEGDSIIKNLTREDLSYLLS